MTITARFQSTCPRCHNTIQPGQPVTWERGQKAKHTTCPPAVAPAAPVMLDLTPIAAFLNAAKDRGLKAPKLRVLAPDGVSELRLGLTRVGHAPGSISVTLAGNFIGCIRPTGETTRDLARDTNLQAHLIGVAAMPAAAAKAYAVLMGLCSFCGLPLTDEGSVEVGYGPVCAKHWGLPHRPRGTRAPAALGASAAIDWNDPAINEAADDAQRRNVARRGVHSRNLAPVVVSVEGTEECYRCGGDGIAPYVEGENRGVHDACHACGGRGFITITSTAVAS